MENLQAQLDAYLKKANAAVRDFEEFCLDQSHIDQEVIDQFHQLPLSPVDRWLENSPTQQILVMLSTCRPEVMVIFRKAFL